MQDKSLILKLMKKVFLMLVVISTLFLACSKDETTVDIRTNVVGTYPYVAKQYKLVGSTLTYLGTDVDFTGTFVVKLNTASSNTIDIWEDGVKSFEGQKVLEATNGVVFDVPSQTADGTTISGYQYWNLGGTKYHGAYTTASKKLEIAYQYTAPISGVPTNIVAIIEGTKQ